QERLLNVPVIPVFWIAGEDHDFDEINHTYMLKDSKLTKHALKQYEPIKKSVSDLSLDKDEVEHWLQNFLNELKETQYTKKWFDKTLQALSGSKTFVDFFAQLIFQLFDR